MSLKSQHMVFIHGEMRVGFWKHYLLKGATFVGHGRTREKYSLCLGAGTFISTKERHQEIEGDVYYVDQRTLDSLDLMQGHPYWCFRETVPIDMGGGTVSAWLYLSQEIEGRMQTKAPTWTVVVPAEEPEEAPSLAGKRSNGKTGIYSRSREEAAW